MGGSLRDKKHCFDSLFLIHRTNSRFHQGKVYASEEEQKDGAKNFHPLFEAVDYQQSSVRDIEVHLSRLKSGTHLSHFLANMRSKICTRQRSLFVFCFLAFSD